MIASSGRADRSRRGSALALGAALIGSFLLIPSGSAQATPDVGAARAQAKRLATQVTQLERETEAATEHFDDVSWQLQQVVSQTVAAQALTDERSNAAEVTDSVASSRVRALYMSGGSVALYATVLDSGDVNDALDRMGAVETLVDADKLASDASWQRVDNAEKLKSKLTDLSAKRTRLEVQARDAQAKVTNLLASRQAALDSANANVVRLVAQVRAEREAAAAAAARSRFATLPNYDPGAPYGNPYAQSMINFARAQIGKPYIYAATGPDAYDCSGLTQTGYRQAGLNLPRTSRQQWFVGPHIALADLRPGDLLFWAFDTSKPATIHHVAVYVGNGQMIEAPHTGAFVRQVPVYLDGYIGATRPGLSQETSAGA